VSQKQNYDTKLLSVTYFQNSFTDGLNRKFATKSLLIIPPHFKRVATLPCEIPVFKQTAMLNDGMQQTAPLGSIAQKSRRKILISLTFVDTEVKNNLHVTKQEQNQFLCVIDKLIWSVVTCLYALQDSVISTRHH